MFLISFAFLLLLGTPLGLLNGIYAYLKIFPHLLYDGLYHIVLNPFIKLLCVPVIHYFIVSPEKKPIFDYLFLELKLLLYIFCILLGIPGYLLFLLGFFIFSAIYGLVCVWDIDESYILIVIKIFDRLREFRQEIYNYDYSFINKEYFNQIVKDFLIETFDLSPSFLLTSVSLVYYSAKWLLNPKRLLYLMISFLFGLLTIPYFTISNAAICIFWLPEIFFTANYRIVLMDNRLLSLICLISFNLLFLIFWIYSYLILTTALLPLYAIKEMYFFLHSQKSFKVFLNNLLIEDTFRHIDRILSNF